jgi:hypothetical protein
MREEEALAKTRLFDAVGGELVERYYDVSTQLLLVLHG